MLTYSRPRDSGEEGPRCVVVEREISVYGEEILRLPIRSHLAMGRPEIDEDDDALWN